MSKTFRIVVDGVEYHVEVEELNDGSPGHTVEAPRRTTTPVVPASPAPQAASVSAPETKKTAAAGENAVLAPLQGKVWQVPVKSGDSVRTGDTLVVIEAMKMENEIVAPRDAVVGEIHVRKGDAVKSGDLLVSLK